MKDFLLFEVNPETQQGKLRTVFIEELQIELGDPHLGMLKPGVSFWVKNTLVVRVFAS